MTGHGHGTLLWHIGSIATNANPGTAPAQVVKKGHQQRHRSMSRSSSMPQLQSWWQ